MKILIAEDDVGIGETYRLILEANNHEVILAREGQECISLFERAFLNTKSYPSSKEIAPFDIVVLDFRMPKKDGVDVASHILALCSSQKIIFATAHPIDTLDGLRKKINPGIEVLQKPFDLDTFVNMIEDFGARPVEA